MTGQLLKLWTIIFTNRLFSEKTKSKLQLLSHQGLQRNFCQNWFTGVSKCPLLTGNSKLVEFQSQKQKPWVSKLQFCYCLFSGVWTLSNLSVCFSHLLPWGKNFPYISLKVSSCTIPSGHSWKKKKKNMRYPNWNGKVIHRNWWIYVINCKMYFWYRK